MKKLLFLILPLGVFAKVYMIDASFFITKPIKSWIELKNVNLTKQKYDYSCGAASLSTVLKYYYEQNISEKKVLNVILKKKGKDVKKKKELEQEDMALSFLDLRDYVKTTDFKAIGLALDLKALKKLKAPVILYVKIRKNEHFTVFRGMDEENVYLSDPSFGNTKIKLSKFKEMFYQREDLKYPGKLLAILPLGETKGNEDFMKIEKGSDMVYDVILIDNIRR